MTFEINVRFVVDATERRGVDRFRDRIVNDYGSGVGVIACEATVSPSQMMPLVTNGDLDRRYDDLLLMAKTLNRHAAAVEERLVEARVNLSRRLSKDLHRLVDDLDAHRG